jgi:membrane-associated protease RseP (regulator of RpoE activity)
MPREMRFCRACGCRLGEGIEEYTETVRFERAPETARNRKSRTPWAMPPMSTPFDRKEFKAMARRIHEQTVSSMTSGLGPRKLSGACKRVPRWMVWIIVPMMIAGMTGGFRSRMSSRSGGRSVASASAQISTLGVDLKSAQGGAFIESVTTPGSAADKAGLVGGDVVTSFDGKAVKSESDLRNILASTPVGKTVEVVYLRDGETKTTRLTTLSEKENAGLSEAFGNRREGMGFLGVGSSFKRVQVPGMSIYGVKLDDVHENGPAYTAGLLDDDIVIEFDRAPIRTREELNNRIDRALPRSTVKVVVVRGIERLEIPVKMGVE